MRNVFQGYAKSLASFSRGPKTYLSTKNSAALNCAACSMKRWDNLRILYQFTQKTYLSRIFWQIQKKCDLENRKKRWLMVLSACSCADTPGWINSASLVKLITKQIPSIISFATGNKGKCSTMQVSLSK